MQSKGKIKLSEALKLLKEYDLFKGSFNLNNINKSFTSISQDTREENTDGIFFCIKGFNFDGHEAVETALKKGAKLLIVEKKLPVKSSQIIVSDTRKAGSLLSALFFAFPAKKMKIIGITGTNGKSTIAHIITDIIEQIGLEVGLIGTISNRINKQTVKSNYTTPDFIELQRLLSEMEEVNTKIVIMEVSSHALSLDRVFGIEFDMVNFTNLTREHLDFHQTIEAYAQAKSKIFKLLKKDGIAFINIDDPYGKKFYKEIKQNKKSISFVKGDFTIRNIRNKIEKSSFIVDYDERHTIIESNLIGKHNIFNLTMSLANVINMIPDISINDIAPLCKRIKQIPGRFEKIKCNCSGSVFIDYAHTPDALTNILKTFKELPHNKLITVFGAGGNRDKTKRPKMLKQALEFSDLIIVTDDNPRDELSENIIKDIVANEPVNDKIWINRDRKAAIETAIRLAHINDIVVVAGKGHETYQEIRGEKIRFSDKEVIANFTDKSKTNNHFNSTAATIPLAIGIDPLYLEYFFNSRFDKLPSNQINYISTDTRDIQNNSLYIPLSGANFNGHKFIDKALKLKGNIALSAENNYLYENTLLVGDTKKAFTDLASRYRKLFHTEIIGITGSTGKTTTKEYIYNILSENGLTLKTLANENNVIGVSKTIFRLLPEDKYAVIEAGSNHLGEIPEITDIIKPDIAVVTSIGASHLEFFKDLDGVYKEKSSILRKYAKRKIFPYEKRFLEFKNQGKSFGFDDNSDYWINSINLTDNGFEFKINNQIFKINSIVEHNIYNSSVAIATAKELEISDRKIQNGLNKVIDIKYRMDIKEINDQTWIFDCYNANPDSMISAIDFWNRFKGEKPHIAILGDMLELGDKSIDFHKDIGKKLKEKKYHNIIAVGKLAKHYDADYNYKDVNDFLKQDILKSIPKNAVVLVKASNSIHLDKIFGEL